MNGSTDVVVIGGGLAGLTAAVRLGRAGHAVTLLEKAGAPGGRAITTRKGGFSLNLGPHALYVSGAGRPILKELGVAVHGRPPAVTGGFAFDRGKLHTLPAGFVSLLTTGLLPLSAKLEVARLLGSIGSIDPAPIEGVSAAAWIEKKIRAPEVRALVTALFRLSTYTADAEQLSAGVALRQLQIALRDNVLYLDGGWQSLVDGLQKAAVEAGVEIVTGARAERIEIAGGAVSGVRLDGGRTISAGAAVIAASPAVASALVPESRDLARYAERAIPVKAACLDVALSKLPRDRNLFALGIDRPLYLSVHSAAAKLAPEGGAVIHVMQYLRGDAAADEAELEALLDLAQPGFRDHVIEKRFLPALTVSNAIVTAAGGGLRGRPDAIVPSIEGLVLAGDWVGPEGVLADGSLASGKRAAELVASRSVRRRAA